MSGAASELISALWTNCRDSIVLYQVNPTPENWRTMKRAYAMFTVAFVDEA